MKQQTLLIVALVVQSMAPRAAVAQTSTVAAPRASELTIERVFASRDFAPDRFGPARWLEDGAAYTTVENRGRDIVRYATSSGERKVLVSAPFGISDYEWSPDGKRVLLFTNTRRVWRYNTRGDYWVLDIASGTLKQLGGNAPESSLMFAKFSPDGTRVGYVRGNNIYVQDVTSGAMTQLTHDGTPPPDGSPWEPAVGGDTGTIVNGTSDWVNEE